MRIMTTKADDIKILVRRMLDYNSIYMFLQVLPVREWTLLKCEESLLRGTCAIPSFIPFYNPISRGVDEQRIEFFNSSKEDVDWQNSDRNHDSLLAVRCSEKEGLLGMDLPSDVTG